MPVPALIPETIPVAETVIMDVLVVVQVPPETGLLNVTVDPVQTAVTPDTAANGFTVIVVMLMQPVAAVKVITDVPPANPVTMPEPDATVATVGTLLVHAPPEPLLRVVVAAEHTIVVPVIGGGNGNTEIVAVMVHPPDPVEYVTATVPAVIPLTMPEAEPIVIPDEEAVLQLPPNDALLNVIVEPTQTFEPTMGERAGKTVTVTVVLQPEGIVYVIADVPGENVLTMPEEEPIAATVVFPLLHTPPLLYKVEPEPLQMVVVPVIGTSTLTLTVCIAWQPVPNA
jgi:hypothetical protein